MVQIITVTLKERDSMQRKLLTNGNTFKRTDGRWGGVVWYADETGERKRKSFSGKTEKAVKNKITEFITNFNDELNYKTKQITVCTMVSSNIFKCSNSHRLSVPHTTETSNY